MIDALLYSNNLRPLVRTDRSQEYYTIRSELAPFLERERGDQDLYDLRADPYELANVSDAPGSAEIIAELRRGIVDWWERRGGGSIRLPE